MGDGENADTDITDLETEMKSMNEGDHNADNTTGNDTGNHGELAATNTAADTNVNTETKSKSRKARERKPRKPRKPYRFAKARRVFWTLVLIWVVAYCINWYFVERRLYAPTKWGAFHKLAVFTYYEEPSTSTPSILPKPLKWQMAEFDKAMGLPVFTSSIYMATKDSYGNKLITLDRRYGNIPEYWEMRPAGSGLNRLDCLQHAIDLNPGCPDLVYFHSLLDAKGFGLTDESQWKPEYDELALKGARKAAEMEPGNGAWNFLIGIELNQLGEYEASLIEFQKSIDAKSFRMPALFPYREYLDVLSDLHKNPEVALFGLGYFDNTFPDTNITMRIRDAYTNTLTAIAMNGDIDALNTLLKCAIRIITSYQEGYAGGGAQRTPDTQFMSTSILIQTIIEWYRDEYGADLQPEDQLALDVVLDKIRQNSDIYPYTSQFSYGAFKLLSIVVGDNRYNLTSMETTEEDDFSYRDAIKALAGGVHEYRMRKETARIACDTEYSDTSLIVGANTLDFSPLSEFDFNCPAESMKRVFEKSKELRLPSSSLDSKSDKDNASNPKDEPENDIGESEVNE